MMDKNYHKCPECGKPVPNERRELLGVDTCIDCTPQQPINQIDLDEAELDVDDLID
jgi:RNA polymerase-binding transcription factor DksA